LAKKFYVCMVHGTCDPETSEVRVFDTSEQVEAFLLENGDYADGSPEDVWVIFGERFQFEASRKPTDFRLQGPAP
jgi:hypothetical protein